VLLLNEVDPDQHFTKLPPRFAEASLVKELDNRYFEATERGQTVNNLLVDTFPELFNVAFTANMEDQFDRVEEGSDKWGCDFATVL
jgi:DNA topoisomerase-1